MIRKLLTYIILLLLVVDLSGQEFITGLINNPAVADAWKKSDMRKGVTSDTLELPFIEDFTGTGVYPDQNKWADRNVFVNNSFSGRQISRGFATFDALDQSGRLYESASSTVFEADILTSLPLNLNYPSTDDIYLSFFYEAGGLGDMPEEDDKLLLHFYAPLEDKWYPVWVAPSGISDGFSPVIIRLDDSRYLKKGFRFRFTGYASLNAATSDPSMASNCDQWNVDYILIDRFRNDADTVPPDVAFTLPVRTILKTNETMPWKQFRQVFLSEMGPWITVNYRNNDKIVRNITRDFQIFDIYENRVAHAFTSGATNIDPGTDYNYKANLLYTFNTDNPDSALFRVKCILTTDAFDYKPNDTIIYYQRFGNYFSFDDGTAEAGYGINGLGSRNAMAAYRYRSYIPDTLRAVNICFNDTYQNSNLRTFDLMVWYDNNGVPGELIYSEEEVMVKQGDGLNGFATYVLNEPKAIFGDFFVGWKQRSETFLNTGFDVNTPHKGRQMYWLNGTWNISQAQGSIMIRPQFGPPVRTVGIDDVAGRTKNIKLWPVPASDILNIDQAEVLNYEHANVRIVDMYGREIMKVEFNPVIDVSALAPGVYFLYVTISNRPVSTGRFIISR